MFSFGTVQVLSESQIPDSYSLNQPYPNPFNPVTSINFSVPLGSEVSLIVYNLKGRAVDVIYQGFIAAGNHTRSWDASEFSSGVYIIKMLADGFSDNQKVILIK